MNIHEMKFTVPSKASKRTPKSSSSVKEKHGYSNCFKIPTLLFLFSYKMLVFRAGTHKMFVRIANREDPDQTASEEAV